MPVPVPRQHPFWCWHSHYAARAVVGWQAAGAMGLARTGAHAAMPCHAMPRAACVCVACACGPAAMHRPGHCASIASSLHAHWHGRLDPWPHARTRVARPRPCRCARTLSYCTVRKHEMGTHHPCQCQYLANTHSGAGIAITLQGQWLVGRLLVQWVGHAPRERMRPPRHAMPSQSGCMRACGLCMWACSNA